MRRHVLERRRNRYSGVVCQLGELLPGLIPVENVVLAAPLSGAPAAQAYERTESLLRGLRVAYGQIPAGQLSSGEWERTAAAEALINQPAVPSADEPIGALDRTTRDAVAEPLIDVPRRLRPGRSSCRRWRRSLPA
jgi:ABC-type lipoprotein export system ATPase subunit